MLSPTVTSGHDEDPGVNDDQDRVRSANRPATWRTGRSVVAAFRFGFPHVGRPHIPRRKDPREVERGDHTMVPPKQGIADTTVFRAHAGARPALVRCGRPPDTIVQWKRLMIPTIVP